jgi:hypothetical protein
MSERSLTKFLEWAKYNQPRFYADVKNRLSVDGLGDWSDVLNTVVTAASKYQADKVTQKQLDINLTRAKQGQDPVNFNALPAANTAASRLPFSSTNPTGYQTYTAPKSNTLLYVIGAVVAIAGLYFFTHKGGGTASAK